LEFVPLAIELAAGARSVVATRCIVGAPRSSYWIFSSAGPRDLPERQQALRRTIQWSYDLLDANEQRVFSELGTFVGSFSLDAGASGLH
jgi:predicted ATPase